jgi:hypothetical protein
MTYVPNSQPQFTWTVYNHKSQLIGRVTTDRKSEAAAKQKARAEYGPDTYTVYLVF